MKALNRKIYFPPRLVSVAAIKWSMVHANTGLYKNALLRSA